MLKKIFRIGLAKVNFDIGRSEEIVRKGFGAIPGFNIAAATAKAKEYLDKLEAVIMALGEGLTTGANTAGHHGEEEAESWQVTAMLNYESNLRRMGEILLGAGKEAVSPISNLMTINEAYEAYLAGKNPEFIKKILEAMQKCIGEEIYDKTHPGEKMKDEMEDAIDNGTAEDQGRMVFKASLIMIDLRTKGSIGEAYLDYCDMWK